MINPPVKEKFAFADEAGCFTFERKQGASEYFIICTVTLTDLSIRQSIDELRRRLVWEEAPIGDYFHATTDKQVVRDAVFETLLKHDFQVQAQICEKAKAQPHTRKTKARFYQYPLYYLFNHGLRPHLKKGDALHVTAAAIGTKKERIAFTNALDDVLTQTAYNVPWVVDFRPSHCDPCLQLADYCAWAIQRKFETARKDLRSYDLIKDRITYEYEMWAHGTKLYY